MHFVTIEDPIEFVHPNKPSRVSQREIGPHSTSFARAVRAAVREEPDCILVGEMRDRETIELALDKDDMRKWLAERGTAVADDEAHGG